MPETHTVPLSLNNCTLATPFWPADHSFRPHCSFPLILCSACVMYSSFYMPLITCMLGGSNIVYNNNKTVHIWRQCHFWITLVSRNQPVRSRAPNPGINPHFVVTHTRLLVSYLNIYNWQQQWTWGRLTTLLPGQTVLLLWVWQSLLGSGDVCMPFTHIHHSCTATR